MISKTVELLGGAAVLAGVTYFYKRKQGAPAPAQPASQQTNGLLNVLPPLNPAPPAVPSSTTTVVALQDPSQPVSQSLGGGVTSYDSGNGIDILSGGDIGQGATDTTSGTGAAQTSEYGNVDPSATDSSGNDGSGDGGSTLGGSSMAASIASDLGLANIL